MSTSSADWDSDAADIIEAPGARGSVHGHHVADSCFDDVELADATVALMSYNTGINNNETNNKMNWAVTYRELWDTSIVARAWLECVIPQVARRPAREHLCTDPEHCAAASGPAVIDVPQD